MGKPHIKVYVDIVSPFGYMGYWMVRNSPIFKDVDTEYVPILLGGLMKACGNTAPLFIKNKDKWINDERLTWATQFDIPMRENVPAGFPLPTVTAQRVLTSLSLLSPTHLPIALDTLYRAFWAPHTLTTAADNAGKAPEININSAETLLSLLSAPSVLGPDLAKRVLDNMGSAETKAALKRNTDAAFAAGAFGLPWFECTDSSGEKRGFWGFDHLGLVVKFLGLDGDLLPGTRKELRPLL